MHFAATHEKLFQEKDEHTGLNFLYIFDAHFSDWDVTLDLIDSVSAGASALATVERVGGIEASALAHEMAAAPRALRAAEAVAAVSMAAGRREAALQAAQLRAESERAGRRSRATQRAAIRRIETVVVG